MNEFEFPAFESHSTKFEPFKITLFSKDNAPLCDVNVIVGLKRDYKCSIEGVLLKPHHAVYFPNNEFSNADPLPLTWLELFTSN